MHVMHSEREQLRTDYDDQFLVDFACNCAIHGVDPRNNVGLNFGFNTPRALQIYHDRVLAGKLTLLGG